MSGLRNRLLVGDARRLLPKMPAASVDCVITSPPYWALRNYDTDGQIGLEPTVDDWVNELRSVLRQVARVLKPSGSLWLNLGDTYSHHDRVGAPPKSLVLGPERLALAMLDDGWTIRNKVVWAKTNAMPISVRDRLACKYEVLYFATRSRHYYFDLDAIRVPHTSNMKHGSEAAARRAAVAKRPAWAGPLAGSNRGLDALKALGLTGHSLGKNPGDVWTYATSNFRGAHHATFPIDLITRPLLASCPEKVCADCGEPWQRQSEHPLAHTAVVGELQPECVCGTGSRPGVVLDPFMGAGTVGVAAEAHQRDWLGIEVNAEFAALANKRIEHERAKRSADRTDSEETPMAA